MGSNPILSAESPRKRGFVRLKPRGRFVFSLAVTSRSGRRRWYFFRVVRSVSPGILTLCSTPRASRLGAGQGNRMKVMSARAIERGRNRKLRR